VSRGPRHRFVCRLAWTGQGATTGYRDYGRDLRVDFDGKPSLEASAAPAFRGEGSRHNPEDLMVAALSACHCLSYLAECARAGVEVVAYEDEATGELALVDGGLQFVDVQLRPRVTLGVGADAARAERLHARAHEACFIARSVNFPVRHEATVTPASGAAGT